MAQITTLTVNGRTYEIADPRAEQNAAAIAALQTHMAQTCANALKGTAAGETVHITAVSPVAHTLTVSARNKNLFNMNAITGSYITNNGDGSITVSTGTSTSKPCTETLQTLAPGLELGKTYILTAKTTEAATYTYLTAAKTSWFFGRPMVMTQEALDSQLRFYVSAAETDLVTVSDIQIEEGTVATDYTPHVEDFSTVTVQCGQDTYSPASDGTVEGVVSQAPEMELTTDTPGVILDVTYNRDLNAAFAALEQTITQLMQAMTSET